ATLSFEKARRSDPEKKDALPANRQGVCWRNTNPNSKIQRYLHIPAPGFFISIATVDHPVVIHHSRIIENFSIPSSESGPEFRRPLLGPVLAGREYRMTSSRRRNFFQKHARLDRTRL